MTRRGIRTIAGGVATALVAALAISLPTGSSAAEDYGPGVAMLESWWDAGTRGDLASDAAMLAAAESKAQDRIGKPKVSLDGVAKTVFAISTPTGAVAVAVQHATDTRGGQTTIAQGVSLPVAVTTWFDETGSIYKASTWFPVSAEESATGPNDGGLLIGVWSDSEQRHLVLMDSGYPTRVIDGYLVPRFSSPDDLLQRTEKRLVDFGSSGYASLTMGKNIIPGSADLFIQQTDPLSNYPETQGGAWDWQGYTHDDIPWDLWFEGHGGTSDLKIKPWPAAYEHNRVATRKAKMWTEQRVSFDVSLWGSPLQAKLPGGERVLFRNVLWGDAYVAFVRFPSDRVVGVRCTTPGRVLAASCRLPRDLGRLFVTDDPFSWRVGSRDWQPGRQAAHELTRAAIIPLRATVRVRPYVGDPYPLFD